MSSARPREGDHLPCVSEREGQETYEMEICDYQHLLAVDDGLRR